MKTPLSNTGFKFDAKFLLVGNSGAGKTHLPGTYTKGPVHFYMLDPGGEKTLRKLNHNRPKDCPITIDIFNMRTDSYSDFWTQLQKDEKSGFFNDMAERNGLVVLPDSLTAASDMALEYIAKINSRDLLSSAKPMRIQDWGMLTAYIKELVKLINALPCAAVVPAHIHIETGPDGETVGRYPFTSGSFRTTMGRFFDEVYLMERQGSNYIINFSEKGRFTAKSRVFSSRSVKNVTMDQIADAYLNETEIS